MTNMSYCRFENTLADLRDCFEQIESLLDGLPLDGEPEADRVTDPRERRSRLELIELCFDVVARFQDEGVEPDANDLRGAIQLVLAEAEEDMPEPA